MPNGMSENVSIDVSQNVIELYLGYQVIGCNHFCSRIVGDLVFVSRFSVFTSLWWLQVVLPTNHHWLVTFAPTPVVRSLLTPLADHVAVPSRGQITESHLRQQRNHKSFIGSSLDETYIPKCYTHAFCFLITWLFFFNHVLLAANASTQQNSKLGRV